MLLPALATKGVSVPIQLLLWLWSKHSNFIIGKYRTRSPLLMQPLLSNGSPYIVGLYGYQRPTGDLWTYTKGRWVRGGGDVLRYLALSLTSGD
jgi:hypothetical protein